MSWFDTRKIADGVIAFSEPGHFEEAISYLVIGSECAALVDTGMGVGNLEREARKMTALLQASNGGPNPILLHYDAASGHSRGAETATSKLIEENTDRFLFLFWQLGMNQPASSKTANAAANH